MEIEKLIERLKAKDFERDYDCTPFECGVFGLLDDAATALEKLQVELKQAERCIEIIEKQRDSAIEELENYMVQDVLDGNEPCGICAKASNAPCECCDPKWRTDIECITLSNYKRFKIPPPAGGNH